VTGVVVGGKFFILRIDDIQCMKNAIKLLGKNKSLSPEFHFSIRQMYTINRLGPFQFEEKLYPVR